MSLDNKSIAEKLKGEEKELTMEDRMAQQLCSYHIGLDDLDESDKPFRYVMTNKGVVRVMQNRIGVFVANTNNIQGLPEIKEGFKLQLPKVPYELFLQTIAFFKEVMKQKSGAEAMLQFFYSPEEKKYIVHCPEQTVSKASAKYKRNQELEENAILVMDIHSHNTMSAFWSSTDNNDEQETRVFGVIGNLDKSHPTWKFRVSVGGDHKDIDIFDIFERPFREIDFPQEWVDKCKKPEVKYHGYSGYGSYYGNYYGGYRGRHTTSGKTYSGGKVYTPNNNKYTRTTGKQNTEVNLTGVPSGLTHGKETTEEDFTDPYFWLDDNNIDTYGKNHTEFSRSHRSDDVDNVLAEVARDTLNDLRAEYLSFEDKVDLVKDLLWADLDAVATAIYEEDMGEEINKEIARLENISINN